MKTQKQRIFSILAILTMAVLLTCIFTACGDSDTGAQDEKPSQAHVHSYSEKNIESHYLASPATCTKKPNIIIRVLVGIVCFQILRLLSMVMR